MRLFILAAMLLAAPAVAQPDPLNVTGNWHGVGLQVDPGGVQSTWTIEITIKADRSGAISYPSLACKGTLHRIAGPANQLAFREEITEGDCITEGHIETRVVNGRLFWFWTKPGVDADASAVLYPAGPIA